MQLEGCTAERCRLQKQWHNAADMTESKHMISVSHKVYV